MEKTATDFSVVASEYLDWSERRHAKKTYEYKRMVFRLFVLHMVDMDVSCITPAVLQSYLDSRPTNHNWNVHRKELWALLAWTGHLGIIRTSPYWSLEKLPVEKKEKIIPTEQELLRILAAANPDTETPLIMILVHTPARVDEILGLRWNDVNFDARTVTLWTRKRKGGSLDPPRFI